MNTDKLTTFANDLRTVFNKHTDAMFIDNLIAEISKRDKITKDAVNRWLLSAFEFPANYENENCIDTYNRSFYHQILEKIQ